MWRLAIAAVLAAGCAQAGKQQLGPPDAASPDAEKQRLIDAPRSIDAPAATCTTSVTCATATMLPGMGGDQTGAGSASATGYQAAWYSIRLTETDSGPLGDPMSIQATLTSPAGAKFDLLVYVNTGADQLDCATPTGTVTTNGASESTNIKWGETGTFANGVDDSRTVSIQISPHSGDTCSPSQTWSLSILTGID